MARFSLIVPTMGRSQLMGRFLQSLVDQGERDLELIVADLDATESIVPLLDEFSAHFAIRRVVCDRPGSAYARNLGAASATGEIIGFPDDDCWYPHGLLDRVGQLLNANGDWDGLVTHIRDENRKAVLGWPDRFRRIDLPLAWRRAMCCAFFFRRELFERLSGYDVHMGHGTNSWGKEDTDILLRAVEAGMWMQYVPELIVRHPQIFPDGKTDEDKFLGYAIGDGLMLGRHPMPLWWKTLFFGMPMLRGALAGLRMDRAGMRRSRLEVKGRCLGYFHPQRCTRALRKTAGG